jgi:hypothetical protein
MPIFYNNSGSIDRIEITSSLISSPSSNVTFQNTITLSGSFSGSYIGSGINLTNINPTDFKSTISSSIVTQSIANIQTTSVLIPAGTYTTGSIIYTQVRTLKTGISGSSTVRIYLNTTNSLTNAILVGYYTGATNTTWAQMTRELVVKPSGLTEFWPIIASIQDNLQSTTAITSSLIDWAQNQYFITAIQNVSASDASVLSSYRIFGV